MASLEEEFRRMAFNIVARNQDDHVKNIAFLMDKNGAWSLSPAFDVTYSHNPGGLWTAQHQMTTNNKRDVFTFEDFIAVSRVAGLKRGRDKIIVQEVRDAVSTWASLASDVGVERKMADGIASHSGLSVRD